MRLIIVIILLPFKASSILTLVYKEDAINRTFRPFYHSGKSSLNLYFLQGAEQKKLLAVGIKIQAQVLTRNDIRSITAIGSYLDKS